MAWDGKTQWVAYFFLGRRKTEHTSTAHQFLIKDLRTGPDISIVGEWNEYCAVMLSRKLKLNAFAAVFSVVWTSLVAEWFSHAIKIWPCPKKLRLPQALRLHSSFALKPSFRHTDDVLRQITTQML
jgi:hypothetical protein